MNKEQKKFHLSRRKEFSKFIGKDSIAIIFGNTLKNRSYDEDYKFKQSKNFYYLTGFEEPNSVLVIAPGGINIFSNGKNESLKEILYVQEKDLRMETWLGSRLGFQNVKNELDIENSFVNEDVRKILNVNSLMNFRRIYVNFGELIKLTGEMKRITTFFIETLNRISPNSEVIDVSYILGKMRFIKSDYEIKMIQNAADASVKSYKRVMKEIKPGVNEFNIQASLEYNYKANGGEDVAYLPIVASGENACILHYTKNNQELKNGDLLIIDSAAEYKYYCSDITRTFPVNGKFTTDQASLYNIVLKANKECIKKIKPGVRFSDLNKLSEKILSEGLLKLGIIKNKKDIKNYSLHGLGHHIGLDAHDAVPFQKTISSDFDILREGNVITIEPGLYFRKDMKEISSKYRGMGIRVEDVVLVTKSGSRNLTGGLGKEIRELESGM